MFSPTLHFASANTSYAFISQNKFTVSKRTTKKSLHACRDDEKRSKSTHLLSQREAMEQESLQRHPASTEMALMQSLLAITNQELDEAKLRRVIACQQVFELKVVGAINRHFTC